MSPAEKKPVVIPHVVSIQAEDINPIDLLLDVPILISVELGRTKVLIRDLLQFGEGSVIELNKLAGEPLDVFINDKLVARGEAIVSNDKFGIRLTDIISPMERIEQTKTLDQVLDK